MADRWHGVERRVGGDDRRRASQRQTGRRRSDYTERGWENRVRWLAMTRAEQIAELRDNIAWAKRQRGRKRLELNDDLMRAVEDLRRLQQEERENNRTRHQPGLVS